MTLSKCDRCGFTHETRLDNTQSVRMTSFERHDGRDVSPIRFDLCRSCFVDVARFIKATIPRPTYMGVAEAKIEMEGLLP